MADTTSGGRGESGEKAREDFLSEAQELVDGLSRDLLLLDQKARQGMPDPELVNDVFRAVHTLKGLSGLFGAVRMAAVSHELEEALDDLRLGRIDVGVRVMDVLFRAVDLYGLLLLAEKGEAPEPTQAIDSLITAIGELSHKGGEGKASPLAQYEIDPSVLGVLTEYEEHRLRTNVKAGVSLFRIRASFALSTIDSGLDELKAAARPHGEIITYLPTGSGTDADSIELEILMASQRDLETLKAALAGVEVVVEAVRKRGGATPTGVPEAAPLGAAGVSLEDLDEGDLALWRPRASSVAPAPSGTPSGTPGATAPPPAPNETAPQVQSRDMSLRSVSQTVRVDIRKLDNLMNVVGELAMVRSQLARVTERARADPKLRMLSLELYRLQRSFERHLAQMQGGILEVRMVPLGQVFEKLARVVRQISREHDKEVNLVITGADTEIDKLIVEELSDPLMHMIRNAIDHGIESREERQLVGKPVQGTVALNAFQKGNHVVIEVEDDGMGMSAELLLETAIKRGIVTRKDAAELSPREVYNLVFVPGFTTRTAATDLSGRGVGMDVVKTNISKLGGVVDITSEVGIGTKITVTLPITLAIIGVLGVEVAGQVFLVPLASIEEAIILDESLVRTFDGKEALTQRGATLPICRLGRVFGLDASGAGAPSRTKPCVVIAQVGERRLGFVVDRLIGQEDIVIKALGKSLAKVRGFAGATELGDQRVGLVLDVAALLEEFLSSDKERLALAGGGAA